MAKRNKKATRKIERLRDRLHHCDENPDMKVGWLTQYIFVMDNFDIGETKRANENRWLYTIGPQRRTRYPFETVVVPSTHYTLHWFMQCKISDPLEVPEFKYVPIPTGATTLPYGTAPYVPTVQISQTKSDWTVVPQEPFLSDAKAIVQCLTKCLNQHNFTIFDARDLMQTLSLKLPLISHEETVCELDFLERQKQGLFIGYQNQYKRKASPVKLEPNCKRPRLDTSTSTLTRMLLELLLTGPVSLTQAVQLLGAKESLLTKVIGVLSAIGHVSFNEGLISSTSLTPALSSLKGCPPRTPPSCDDSDDSDDPIPETPPYFMPNWDSVINGSVPDLEFESPFPALVCKEEPPSFPQVLSEPPPTVLSPLQRSSFPKLAHPLPQASYSTPPPTQPARAKVEPDRVKPQYPMDLGSISILSFDKLVPLNFEPLDFIENPVDFYQSSFWDQF